VSADLTMKQGDLQPELRAQLTNDDGTPVDLTGAASVALVMLNSADEELIFDHAASIVSPPTSGIVTYQWVTGETDTAGLFLVSWVVTWSDGAQTFPGEGYTTVEFEGAETLEAWANTSDVRKVTGEEVDSRTVLIAQGIIETYLNRVWRATDATGRDAIWLRRAVSYQSQYVGANPELFTGPAGVQSIKQGDNSITYSVNYSSTSDGSEFVAPLAKLACARVRRAYGTIKPNSMYQHPERKLPPWRPAW
jgi:hypothetical protein